jgi:hypothetical protein
MLSENICSAPQIQSKSMNVIGLHAIFPTASPELNPSVSKNALPILSPKYRLSVLLFVLLLL